MKIIAYFLFLSLLIILKAQNQWILVFEDNFNGYTIDTSKWFNYRPWGNTTDESVKCGCIVKENVKIENGFLNLRLTLSPNSFICPMIDSSNKKACVNTNDFYKKCCCEKDTVNTYRCTGDCWKAGMIWSKPYFKYGVFKARIKFPAEYGTWGAYWLYGRYGLEDEIDIVEQLWPKDFDKKLFTRWERIPVRLWGENSKKHVDLKVGVLGKNISDLTTKEVREHNWYKPSEINQWHIYTLIWEDVSNNKAQIRVYRDNKQIAKFTENPADSLWSTKDHFTLPYPYLAQSLIFGLSKKWYGSYEDIGNSTSLLVDWVQVWQPQNCTDPVKLCSFNPAEDNNFITGKNIIVGCSAPITLNNNKHLHLLATNSINLKPGFKVNEGAYFAARIVPCSQTTLDDILPKSEKSEDEISYAYHEFESVPVSIQIYPNPFHQKTTIYIHEPFSYHLNGAIFDLSMRMIYQFTIPPGIYEYTLPSLPEGCYIVNIHLPEKPAFFEKICSF